LLLNVGTAKIKTNCAKLDNYITAKINLNYDYDTALLEKENVIGLPDSVYGNPSNQYPISRYAIRYFEFEYIQEEDMDANGFYLQQLLDFYTL